MINFPDPPLTNGQIFTQGSQSWTWDTVKWIPTTNPATALVYIGDTPPPAPVDGTLWWHSNSGNLYLRFSDGTSTQWVPTVNQLPDNPTQIANGGTGATTAAGALTNLGAVAKIGDTMTGTLNVNLNASPIIIADPGINISGVDNGWVSTTLTSYGASVYPQLVFRASRGTGAARTVSQTDDGLGSITAYGASATNTYSIAGRIVINARENWTASAQGSYWQFININPGTTVGNVPLILGRGVIVGGVIANDPGPGGIYQTSKHTINANTATLPAITGGAACLLQIATADTQQNSVVIDAFGSYPELRQRTTNGTLVSPLATTANMPLMVLSGYGYYGAYVYSGQIVLWARENFTASARGTYITFETTQSGTTTVAPRVAIGNGLMVGGTLANDPGIGNIYAAAAVLAAGGFVTTATTGIGKVSLIPGDATQVGYIAWHKPNGTRMAYMGWANTDVNLNLEAGARFLVSNGSVCVSNNNTWWCGLPNPEAWYGVAAYTYPNQSDARSKKSIRDLPDFCLALVRAINPKRYELVDGPPEDKGRIHWGFVAQDVGEVMDREGHDFSGGHRIDNDWHSLDYGQMTAVLWKATQELLSKIDNMQAEIDMLKSR